MAETPRLWPDVGEACLPTDCLTLEILEVVDGGGGGRGVDDGDRGGGCRCRSRVGSPRSGPAEERSRVELSGVAEIPGFGVIGVYPIALPGDE